MGARYRNRWVVTAEMKQEQTAGRRIFNSSFSAPSHADLANTNIIHHAGRYLALYEAGAPYEVDSDINTVRLFNYDGKLPSVMSAHPKLDPFTGELLSVAYDAKTGALAYLCADQIEVTFPWYDSFSLTHPSARLELHRLTINLKKKSVADQTLDDRACEFSRINDAHIGRKVRYGYVGLRDPRPGEKPQLGAFEAMARYDLTSGKKVVHQFPAGSTVCEPLFVADPHGKSEEDGFIFSFVHQQGSAGGSFVILDARRLAGMPLATVHLPRRVPAALHGSWIPA
jgi:carotenoid cleavage dioxygenase-like enzyme